MDTPSRAAVRGALARGISALEAASTAEWLIVSEEEMLQVDAPTTAAFVLRALASDPERMAPVARPLVRYLQESRDASGLWRPWHVVPPLPPGTGVSALAGLALSLWGEPPPDSSRLLDTLLASQAPDGACSTWVGPAPEARSDEGDMLARVDVLALASHLGQEPRALASFVEARLEARGLEAYPRAPFTSSPAAFAYALAWWLRRHEDKPALRRLVWRDCTRYREDAMRNPLECALMLSALLILGPPQGEAAWDHRLEDMATLLVQAQDEVGLWPALPVLTDAHGRIHGSLQLTTAACLEALTRYAQGWVAPGRAPVAGPPLPASRGRRSAALRRDHGLEPQARPGTWGDTLGALRDSLTPALLSPEAFTRVGSIAHWLPAALTNGFGLELRLSEPEPRADVFFWINSDSLGREILAGTHPHVTLRDELLDNPTWRNIREFSRQWAEPGSLLGQGVDSFWLEFDVGPTSEGPPVPVLFACPEEMTVPEEPTGAREARRRHQDIAARSLRVLSADTLAAETLRNVLACVEALPPGSQPFALGLLPSRGLETVRFCAKDISAERMGDYLAAVGWTGSHTRLRELLDWLAPCVDRFVLDIDVGARVLPQVGLECSFLGRRQPSAEPRWSLLFEELVRRGLCLDDKRDMLMRWPGLSSCVERGGGEVRESRFDRRLSHLKLSLKPELEAKGYLGAWRYFEERRS